MSNPIERVEVTVNYPAERLGIAEILDIEIYDDNQNKYELLNIQDLFRSVIHDEDEDGNGLMEAIAYTLGIDKGLIDIEIV